MLNILLIRLADERKNMEIYYIYKIREMTMWIISSWIKNLSRFMSSQLSKHHGQKYICDKYTIYGN